MSNTSSPIYNPLTRQTVDERFSKQNKQLDLIEKGLGEYAIKASAMKDELTIHDKALNELDSNVEDANEKVINVSNRTKLELKFTTLCGDCGYLPCIIFLIIVIMISICLIIWGGNGDN